jgi:aminopeptidase N
LKAERVRGFTIYAYPHWQRRERRVGQIELGICLPTEATAWADRMLDSAADAIAFYVKEYAPFPSRHLDIICPGSVNGPAHGSSAACNVITMFLGGRFEDQYRQLIAHEVAHQYWGNAIGLPRNSIGWVPVGLGLMMDEHYAVTRGLDATLGRKIMREFYFRAEKMGFDTTLSQPLEQPLQSPPPWSFGWNMSLMHGKGYAVCSLLRDLLGAEKFQGVIRKLIKEYSGGVIHDGDLIAACESALGKRLDWFTAEWVNGRATLDYAISAVNKSHDGWDVAVTRVGTAGFPVMVEVVTKSGERFRQRANRTQAIDTLHFKTTGAIKAA